MSLNPTITVFLAALLFIGLGVLGMAFNIIFRKKEFPQTDVGSNEEMRKRGIHCMKEEEDKIWGNKAAGKGVSCDKNYSSSCIGCSFYNKD
jgi:hypothetical protein